MADQSIKDLAYRTAASIFGGPVDLATMVMRPFGYRTPDTQVVGGSEWIGKKLEDVGLVSSARSPLAEFITSMAVPTPGGLAKGAAMAAPAIGGMFIGKGAKTWDALAAAKAQELEKAGTDARTIWLKTGNWKGPDGSWRQEIDDSAAKLRDYQFTPKEALAESYYTLANQPGKLDRIEAMKPYANMSKNQLQDEYKRTGKKIIDAAMAGDIEKANELQVGRQGLDDMLIMMGQRRYGPASSYMSHGELGAAYPDVYKMHTRIDGDMAAKGQYSQGTTGVGEQMVLKKKPMWSEDKSTTLHEMQHAIQQREGFARGGSPENFFTEVSKARDQAWNRISEINSELSAASGTPRYQQLLEERQSLIKLAQTDPLDLQEQAYRQYQRLAGEAEARATQARMNMTPEQRRAMFPEESYDVPINQLIIRNDGGPMRSASKIDDLAYRGSHRAPGPDSGAPLYDLTGGGQFYPADVYSSKATQYYGTGYPKADKEAFALAQRVRGNPDAVVTIYRAVPKDPNITQINTGDWVTLSKDYAKTHGESVLSDGYKIISQKVKAKDIFTSADSIHEFGYYPQ